MDFQSAAIAFEDLIDDSVMDLPRRSDTAKRSAGPRVERKDGVERFQPLLIAPTVVLETR